MGVPTGGAPDRGNRNPGVSAATARGGDHHTVVAFEGRATADGTAFRTVYLMKSDVGQRSAGLQR